MMFLFIKIAKKSVETVVWGNFWFYLLTLFPFEGFLCAKLVVADRDVRDDDLHHVVAAAVVVAAVVVAADVAAADVAAVGADPMVDVVQEPKM